MEIESFIVILVAIVALVIIVYMVREKLKSAVFSIGNLFKASIDTHKATESEALMAEAIKISAGQTTSNDEAFSTLQWIQNEIKQLNGSYIRSDSTLKNKEIITLMYTKCTKRLIGTAFFENPAEYGDDLASFVRPGIEYIRITTSNVCPHESQEILKERMKGFQSQARLVAVPVNTEISKLAGLFCEMKDGSYLAFIALNNVGNSGENHGVAFCGDIAENLFNYYNSWASL